MVLFVFLKAYITFAWVRTSSTLKTECWHQEIFFLVLDIIRYSCSIRYICHRFLEYNFNHINEMSLSF